MAQRRILYATKQKPGPGVPRAAARPRTPIVRLRFPARANFVSGQVSVYSENTLGQAGLSLAQKVSDCAVEIYSQVAEWLGLTGLGQVKVLISPFSAAHDGTGGAEHATCEDTTIYVDACFTDDGSLSCALFQAELIEVAEALAANGWDCGESHGEGLSRVGAEMSYLAAMAPYYTAALWLDSDRPDYVNYSADSDTDQVANGCAVLFLWWLIALKGYDFGQICAAGGETLAEVYANLGEGGDAFAEFSVAVEERWPAGSPSGVTSDNPWVEQPPPPPPPPCEVTICVSADLPAGTYCLTPLEDKGVKK